MRLPPAPHPPRPRHGHALVELLIAALLLTVGASATLSLLQATVAAAAQSVQLSAARAVAREQSETLLQAPCAASTGHGEREGLTALWSHADLGSVVEQTVTLHRSPTPLGGIAPPTLTTTVRGWCP